MRTARQRAGAWDDFAARHGHLVTTALQSYAGRMRETAEEAHATSQVPAPPDQAGGDGTISLRPAPAGFERMALIFREAAESADAAREAWDALTDNDEDW